MNNTIIPASEIQVGDIITVKPPRGSRFTFEVEMVNDLAVTGWGVSAKTLRMTHQHRLVSRSWVELSDVTLVRR